MSYRRTVVFLVSIALLTSFGLRAPDSVEAQQGLGAQGLSVHESVQSFEATWASLIDALHANPNIKVIGTVDHAAAASRAGLGLAPNRIVIFGNPKLGSPVMAAGRSAALDLPQKMQVFEHHGRVYVAYNPTTYLAARHGAGAAPTLPTIAGALRNLASIATGTELGAASASAVPPGVGLTTTASANDFETTWSKLVAAIDKSPANIALTVDHGANSAGVLSPTRLVVFGNPNLGTPLMVDRPTAGIDLPLKIVVWEDSYGVTNVSSTDVAWIKQRHGIGDVATLQNATGAIANFTRAATAPTPIVTAPASPAAAPANTPIAGLAHTGSRTDAVVVAFGLLWLGGACTIISRRQTPDRRMT